MSSFEPATHDNYNPVETVMVVDDDPIFRMLMEQVLLQRGAKRVIMAADGEEAHQILRRTANEIDAITLDLSMPNQDGVGFLRLASELSWGGRLVLVSGEHQSVRHSAGKLATMMKIDCAGVLPKPADYQKVAELVLSGRNRPQRNKIGPGIDVEEINSALRNSRLVAYYQPRIDIESGRVAGAEALARMRNREGQLLDAGKMINLAEENGRITDITWRMIELVTEDTPELIGTFDEAFKISFNISGSIISNSQFPGQFCEIIRLSGLNPENFILELTETRLPQDTSQSLEALTRLRMQGFGLAIDDFGTGYSNIEQLRLFPFSELKIDKSFMSAAATDRFAFACVEASVSLARQLELRIVAEGIETMEELELARQFKIDEAQGYLFSRPLPFADFKEFLQAHGTVGNASHAQARAAG